MVCPKKGNMLGAVLFAALARALPDGSARWGPIASQEESPKTLGVSIRKWFHFGLGKGLF